MTCWWNRSVIPTLALLVALGTLSVSSSLLANDHEKKDKARDPQSSVQSRDGADEDLNAQTDPEKFVNHVAQSGIKEIRLAQLAKQRAQSQEVKEFADKLIQDHTKANQELKMIAQRQNIPWQETPAAASGTVRADGTIDTSPPVTSSDKEITRSKARTPAEENGTARGAYAATDPYAELVGLSGKSFDDAFLNHEVKCHSKAVAKFEKASKDLPDGELKRFVVNTLPTLREHLAMAQRMAPIRERSDRDSKGDLDQANK